MGFLDDVGVGYLTGGLYNAGDAIYNGTRADAIPMQTAGLDQNAQNIIKAQQTRAASSPSDQLAARTYGMDQTGALAEAQGKIGAQNGALGMRNPLSDALAQKTATHYGISNQNALNHAAYEQPMKSFDQREIAAQSSQSLAQIDAQNALRVLQQKNDQEAASNASLSAVLGLVGNIGGKLGGAAASGSMQGGLSNAQPNYNGASSYGGGSSPGPMTQSESNNL